MKGEKLEYRDYIGQIKGKLPIDCFPKAPTYCHTLNNRELPGPLLRGGPCHNT